MEGRRSADRRADRPAFGEDVGGFVRVSQEALRGSVSLMEDYVAHQSEACGLPCGEENIYAIPAVERNAQAVRLQHAIHVGKGIEDPARIAVVSDGAAGAVLIPNAVRRVRQHEINTLAGQSF